MKNLLMSIMDKILLRERTLVETVDDELNISLRLNTRDIALSTTLSQISYP